MHLRRFAALIVVLFLTGQAFAQTLADKVPESAHLYIGWNGTDNLGSSFPGSHAQAILKQSSLAKLIDDVLPQLPRLLIDKKDTASIESVNRLIDLGKILAHKPCALFAKLPANDQSPLQWAILVKAGTDATKVMDTAQRTLEAAGTGKEVAVSQKDDIVILSGGFTESETILSGKDDSLLALESFKSSITKLVKEPVLTVFVNIAETRVRAQALGADGMTQDQSKLVDNLLDALGLTGVQSFTLASGFSGKDWQTDAIVLAPEPHKGLTTLLENRPFNEELLKRIPDTATSVKGLRFDIVKFIKTTQASVIQAMPEAQQPIEQVLAGAKLSIGKDLINDILEPLGDEWVIYNAPDVGGEGFVGSVIVNKPDNAFKLKQGLSSLSIAISNLAPMAMPQDFKFSGKTIKVGDTSVFYFSLPGVAPSWSVTDGFAYFGLHPQTVISAIQRQGKTILDKPDFTEALARMERKDIAGFGYTDVHARIDRSYELLLVGTRLGVGLLESKGATIPEPVLPPLNTLKNESNASVSVVWADKDGWNYHAVSPFPLADLLCSPFAQIDTAAPAIAILLPSLNRAREAANEVKSMSNIRQIGLACFMYASDHKGNFPDSMDDLLKGTYLTDKSALLSTVGNNEPFVYLGSSKIKMPSLKDPSATPLAFDPITGEARFAVLFCDGHVEMIDINKKEDILNVAKEAGMNVP